VLAPGPLRRAGFAQPFLQELRSPLGKQLPAIRFLNEPIAGAAEQIEGPAGAFRIRSASSWRLRRETIYSGTRVLVTGHVLINAATKA
jgi:hypothetical protein